MITSSDEKIPLTSTNPMLFGGVVKSAGFAAVTA
jgi:hypothetical protein